MQRGKAIKFLVFGVPSIITFGLGTWQTQRYFWKQNLIEERKKSLKDSCLETIEYDNVSKILYHKVKLTGKFDHDKEVYVGLRKLQQAQKTGLGSFGDAGYYIVTPFVTTDGHIVLVNRGWIPRQDLENKDRRINEVVTIEGIVREPERPGMVSNTTNTSNKIFLAVIPSDIENVIGIKTNFLMDQTSELIAYKNQPQLFEVEERYLNFQVMPSTHAVYALTWYSLCFWALGTAYYLKKKKKL